MKAFVSFMASPAGRLARILAGTALILWGLVVQGELLGYFLAGLGLIPLLSGVFNVCLIAPLLSGPIDGRNLRSTPP
jgi:hypothetical protein